MSRLVQGLYLLLAILHSGATARADSTVVFNEVMYHPADANGDLQWIELHNQMGVNMDVSGWSLAGAVQFRFAEGTVLPGGAYVVVAASPAALAGASGATNVYGPFLGRLPAAAGRLELRNNNQRLMDWVDYDSEGDWPTGPDGSGMSLAKADPDAASPPAGNWASSTRVGGTPGAANVPGTGTGATNTVLLPMESLWRYEATGIDPGPGWRSVAFDDGAWASAPALFYGGSAQPPSGNPESLPTLFNTGVDAARKAVTPGNPDPHYQLTVSAQGSPPPPPIAATVILNHPAWVANDGLSSWIGPVNPGTVNVAPGPYRYRTTFALAGFDPATAQILLTLAADNRVNDVLLNGASHGIAYEGFSGFSPTYTLSSGFVAGTNTLEFLTANDATTPNPAGFRARLNGTAVAVLQRSTQVSPVPATAAFRAAFVFNGDPAATALTVRAILNDGAVFFLNGAEVRRIHLPADALDWGTPASTNLADGSWSGSFSISSSPLVTGTNILAVELHQSASGTNSLLFGAELSAAPAPPSAPAIAFNEIAPAGASPFWLELANRSAADVPLQGCALTLSGQATAVFAFSPEDVVPGGGFLALDESRLGFHPQSGDRLFLYGPNRRSLFDAVVVKKTLRGRHPDGSGPWLYPAAPTPGGPNLFVFHDEIVINEIMYHPRDTPAGDSPEAWIELFNRSGRWVDLSGWELDQGVHWTFPPGTAMDPGAYLVVTSDTNYLRAIYPQVPIAGNFTGRLSHKSDRILLRDSNRNPVSEVRYFDGGRWPEEADGGGSSLELRNPYANTASPESWAPSDESGKAAWNRYSYRGVAAADGGPTLWSEFVMGLLDRGQVLLDDISVIESPDTAPRELIQNGSFESGAGAWRILGNHRGDVVVDPDNPGNHVLRLTATGPTEHMHNHAETTLAGGATVVNGRTYQVSFRAKCLSGANRLHTRLYFNRVAQVTLLDVPARCGTPGAPNSRLDTNPGPAISGFRHQPAVPAANQPVTVSVSAADPDGVAGCTLRWSANGGTWNSQAMVPGAEGDGAFEGVIPGAAASTVVQFYVEAADLAGARSAFPAAGPASRALYKVDDSQAIAGPLHNLRLVMTVTDAVVLHAATNVMSNGRMGATVIYDEREVFYDVGVHLQSSERGRADPSRVGFTIEFAPDHLFRGVHDSVTVDRSGGYSGIGGDQDEIVLKHAINHAGGMPGMYDDLVRFIAPLDQHTGPGLLLMAKYGDEFLDTQYPDGGEGLEFKLELIYYPLSTTDGNPESLKLPQPDDVLGTDIQDRGAGEEAYRWFFLTENHRAADDYGPMIALARAFSLSGSALDTRSRQLMDVDEWLRAFAMKSLSGDVDTYSQGYPHNLILYFRPDDGRALAFLWDMDFSWVRAVNSPLIGSANVAKVISLPNNRRLYYAHLNDIITTTFNTSYLAPWTTHYAALIGQDYSGVLSYIGQRAAYVRSQFPAQVPFAITTNGGQDLQVNAPSAVLSGTAWLNVRQILIEGLPVAQPGAVNWSSLTNWQATVPLILGTNQFRVLAYDFSGNLAATRAITITSTTGGGGDDSDHDGMPDAWETAMDLAPFTDDADDDPDGDGMSNLQEYLAGTNPWDASSRLALSAIASPGGVRLAFRAAAGRSYSVQYRDGLESGSWVTLTNVPPQVSDTAFQWIDAPSANVASRFFRLTTPQQ